MSRKQFSPHGSSHEKKMTRKERKKFAEENPIVNSNQNTVPDMVSAPTEEDKKQLKNLTLFFVVGLILLLGLMYFVFISSR
jgi:hypothetical protein